MTDPIPLSTFDQWLHLLTFGRTPQLFIADSFWPTYFQYASEAPVDEDLDFVFDGRCHFASFAAVQQY